MAAPPEVHHIGLRRLPRGKKRPLMLCCVVLPQTRLELSVPEIVHESVHVANGQLVLQFTLRTK